MKNEEALNKRLARYWNTILLWSGYDRYLEVRDIAKILKIESRTVSRRIQWFKQHYPEQYAKIKADRAAIKRASIKLDRQLEEISEGKFLSYTPDMDNFIKEKF